MDVTSPLKKLDDKKCRRSAQRAPTGFVPASDGGPQRQTRPVRGRSEGGGDSGGTDAGIIGTHVGPLPPAMTPMEPGQEDVEHGTDWEGGVVSLARDVTGRY